MDIIAKRAWLMWHVASDMIVDVDSAIDRTWMIYHVLFDVTNLQPIIVKSFMNLVVLVESTFACGIKS